MSLSAANISNATLVWALADTATAQVIGLDYFHQLVRSLSAILDASHVFIGECIPDNPLRVRTLALWADGARGANFEYDLANTPCDHVVGRSLCWYEQGVAEQFPADRLLTEMGVVGYVGIPLFSATREALGILVVLNRAPITPSEETKILLKFCAARAGVELERLRIESRERLGEQRLSASIESTPNVAVQWYDENGLIRLWNKASEQFYGYSAEQVMGKPRLDGIFSEASNHRFHDALAWIHEHGGSVGPLEFEVRRSDGTLGFCESVVFAIPGEKGGHWIVCMDIDVTSRKRAEAELRDKDIQYRHLIESSPVPMLVTDDNQRILLGNAKFTELFGYTIEELSNLDHLRDLAYPDATYREMVQQEWSARLSEARDGGKPIMPFEVDFTCRDGNLRRVQLNATLCSDRMLIVFMDLTDRSRLENELRHAQKLEVVGQLAGGVAHDFNNIIQGVLGFIGLAQDTKLSAADRDLFLREALSSAKRASQLTRQLLAFGRRQAMHMEDTVLPDLVSNLLKLLRRLIGEHIEVKLSCGQAIGNVRCDRTQIEQVLINLCVNARDAMPKGGRITISIENKSISQSYKNSHPWARVGRFVVLSVSDTGCGMDTATQERVFEPFFTTKPKDKGTGLGLAVVYGIVRQHEGIIRLQSMLGVGTTFSIYLPIIEQSSAPSVTTAAELPVPGGSETILVAEDDDSIRNLIRRILERAGYQVLSAVNGEEAVGLFQHNKERIALLLFDAVMPKLSGFEAYARIRAMDCPRIPVIFASGYNDVFSHATSMPKDTVYIQKPYDPDELLRRIRQLLTKPAPLVPS